MYAITSGKIKNFDLNYVVFYYVVGEGNPLEESEPTICALVVDRLTGRSFGGVTPQKLLALVTTSEEPLEVLRSFAEFVEFSETHLPPMRMDRGLREFLKRAFGLRELPLTELPPE